MFPHATVVDVRFASIQAWTVQTHALTCSERSVLYNALRGFASLVFGVSCRSVNHSAFGAIGAQKLRARCAQDHFPLASIAAKVFRAFETSERV